MDSKSDDALPILKAGIQIDILDQQRLLFLQHLPADRRTEMEIGPAQRLNREAALLAGEEHPSFSPDCVQSQIQNDSKKLRKRPP